MNNSATDLDFDATMMWVSLADGRKLGVPLAYFPRLLTATPGQRQHVELSGGGTGMHWDELDEDISLDAPTNLPAPCSPQRLAPAYSCGRIARRCTATHGASDRTWFDVARVGSSCPLAHTAAA